MPCTYCNHNGHNISQCSLAAFERAFEIYNDGVDSYAKKRKNIFYSTNANITSWLTDRNGHTPSHPDWNTQNERGFPTSNSDRFVLNRIPPAERNVINFITKFRNLSTDIIIDAHPNMDYSVVKMNTSPPTFIKINRVVTDNRSKIVTTTFENYQAGHGHYSAFEAATRRLNQLRREHHAQQWRQRMEQQRHEEFQQRRERAEQNRRQQQQQQLLEQQRQIDNLVLREQPVEAKECAICFEPFSNTNKMILRCGHQFCGDCIFHHFQGKGGTKCPQCRAEFAIRVSGWKPPGDIIHNTQQQTTREIYAQNIALQQIISQLTT
jgi:hypothetical protein